MMVRLNSRLPYAKPDYFQMGETDMNKEKRCAYCGSDKVSLETSERYISEPFSETERIVIWEKVCSSCGFTEESDQNDQIIQATLLHLRRNSMVHILDQLNRQGYSNASMERILSLPARTLARWKNDTSMNPSAAALALMRIIRTFPWILAVADMGFEPSAAREILLAQALPEMKEDNREFVQEPSLN